MDHRNRLVLASRWLLPILALFLMLGHACELPAFVDLVVTAHPTEDADHAAHHQGHGPELSCDPVDAVASTGSVAAAPLLDAARVVSPDSPLPTWLRTTPPEGAKRGPSRPPLFLLHASLLI